MPNRDKERLEEELAGATRPSRERGLSGEYLLQALESLHAAGDPAALFDHWRRFPPKDVDARRDQMIASARRLRVKFARTSVLFAALAAESYVNEFLAAHGVLDNWDRETTPRKYLKGTAEAYGGQLFFTDREAYPVILQLFELRHKLVHPKPGFGVTGLYGDPEAKFEREFELPKVAEYVVMVGGSADLLVPRAYGLDRCDIPGMVVWRGRTVIRDFARRNKRLPALDAPPERSLFRQAGDYVMAMRPLPDHPEASWTQLREARTRTGTEGGPALPGEP
jgi:hypothetical protein